MEVLAAVQDYMADGLVEEVLELCAPQCNAVLKKTGERVVRENALRRHLQGEPSALFQALGLGLQLGEVYQC